jgi:hypothetical protein
LEFFKAFQFGGYIKETSGGLLNGARSLLICLSAHHWKSLFLLPPVYSFHGRIIIHEKHGGYLSLNIHKQGRYAGKMNWERDRKWAF